MEVRGLLLIVGLCLALVLSLFGCALTPHPESADEQELGVPVPESEAGRDYADFEQIGLVSFYAEKFHGRKTASGDVFDKHAFTAAHRTLPFGTRIRVTHLANGRSVIVTVNDRGPFTHNRILDLSQAAAREIGMIGTGTAKVKLEAL